MEKSIIESFKQTASHHSRPQHKKAGGTLDSNSLYGFDDKTVATNTGKHSLRGLSKARNRLKGVVDFGRQSSR